MDPGEEALDELARLAEPLAEQRMRVDLDQARAVEATALDDATIGDGPIGHTDRQLLRERSAQRRLASAGRAVQQRQPLERDDAGLQAAVA